MSVIYLASLTLYGGAGEIGGNKILIKDKGSNVFLDFGEEFNFGSDFFYDWLAPRNVNGMELYFELNLMPRIPGLYSKSMLERSDMKYEKPKIDAIFISHAHSDHFGHIKFVDESIPIYIGHCAHRIIQNYNELYRSIQDLGVHDTLMEFESGSKITAGEMKVEPIHVEHSIPGAYGFVINTSAGSVVYTGDLRMHGPRSDMTEEFIRKANKAEPEYLLIEGTRVTSESERNLTEQDVAQRVDRIIKEAKSSVFCYFPMANVDRFMSFYRAAVENDRILVIDTRLAYMIQNLHDKIMVLPDVLKDKNIRVYFRLEKSCKFDDMDYSTKDRLFCPKMITADDIAKRPNKYVIHLNFNKLIELIYIKPHNADFIYSSSEHFYEGEENEEQRRVWQNWMAHFGMRWHMAHCSGHASREDLTDIIETIKPKTLIPVHTDAPDEFRKIHPKIILPKKGETLKL